MYMLVKLKSEVDSVKNLQKELDFAQFRSGTTIVTGYKSELEWLNHLTDLVKHSIHQNYVDQINNLQHIMKSENLPMIVARTDSENVRRKLEENGFDKLESVVS